MKPRVKAEWQSYLLEVLPAGMPRDQLIETRRAFYAGSRALLTLIVGHFPATLLKDPKASRVVEDLERELEAFKRDVLNGKA